MEPRELRMMGTALQELGLSYKETLEVMKGVSKDLHSVKTLWKDCDKSKLVRIGLTLVAFPEPTPISETLGAIVLSLGVVQNRRKKSALHVEDVYKVFQDVNRSLLRIREDLG